MAPLTRMRADADGVMGEMNAEYYSQRAGAGLIVAEGTFPHHAGKSYPGQPGLETSEQVAGWRLVTDAVHASGGRIFVQLMHGGRISHQRIIPGGLDPVAPSAVRPEGEARLGSQGARERGRREQGGRQEAGATHHGRGRRWGADNTRRSRSRKPQDHGNMQSAAWSRQSRSRFSPRPPAAPRSSPPG